MTPDLPAGYGQVAYEGYCNAADELFRGTGSVPWSQLDQRLQKAWNAGAQALADYLDRIPR